MYVLLIVLFLFGTGPSATMGTGISYASAQPSTRGQDAGLLYARFNEFTKFDGYFSKYSKRYFGAAFDWRYFKAQAIAESHLKEDARSAVGAVGIMQVMPRTFEEIRQKNPNIRGGLNQPRWNIAAGISYDRQHYLVWNAPRPLADKLKFMFGSYNAGRRNILNAQRLALADGLDENAWSSIETQLPAVTGAHNIETRNYITRIFEIKPVLK
jgi:membrane-bound lytic murein transglycosylase MltF